MNAYDLFLKQEKEFREWAEKYKGVMHEINTPMPPTFPRILWFEHEGVIFPGMCEVVRLSETELRVRIYVGGYGFFDDDCEWIEWSEIESIKTLWQTRAEAIKYFSPNVLEPKA